MASLALLVDCWVIIRESINEKLKILSYCRGLILDVISIDKCRIDRASLERDARKKMEMNVVTVSNEKSELTGESAKSSKRTTRVGG